HARLHSSNRRCEAPVSFPQLACYLPRRPDLGLLSSHRSFSYVPGERRRENPDDRSRPVAEHHASTGDPSIAREPPLPERVRNDPDALAARFSVVVVKRSSEDRLDAQHREEVCSRILSRDLFGISVAGQARARVKVRGHILKDRVLLFPVKEVSEV